MKESDNKFEGKNGIKIKMSLQNNGSVTVQIRRCPEKNEEQKNSMVHFLCFS